MAFVANFIRFPAVQNFLKNLLRFDNVTESLNVGTFLRYSVDGIVEVRDVIADLIRSGYR